MVAYKDEERGTWYVSFYYEDWTGAKKRKVKRGFRTKKEALNFEAERRKDCGSAKHGTIHRHHIDEIHQNSDLRLVDFLLLFSKKILLTDTVCGCTINI